MLAKFRKITGKDDKDKGDKDKEHSHSQSTSAPAPPPLPQPVVGVHHVMSPGTQSRYIQTLREYSILLEYRRLNSDQGTGTECPGGLYIVPSTDSLRRWHGVIFIRKGFYKGGIFKFLLHLPTSYP